MACEQCEAHKRTIDDYARDLRKERETVRKIDGQLRWANATIAAALESMTDPMVASHILEKYKEDQ